MGKRLWYALSTLLLVGVVGILLVGPVFHLFTGTLACHIWQSKATAPLDGTTQFSSLSLLSSSDVWLAGSNVIPDSSIIRPLVEHWDGQHWQTLFPPNPGNFDGGLNGIAAVSDNDVWAVGNAYDTYDNFALAVHWDGRTWRTLPAPSTPALPPISS